jgi:hypothetical protein
MKKFLVTLACVVSLAAMAADPSCVLKRNASGAIARSTTAVNTFKRTNACPGTGKASTASCPGYIVDHIQPLCACGPDTSTNMQWQSLVDSKIKDKLENAQCAALKKSGNVK